MPVAATAARRSPLARFLRRRRAGDPLRRCPECGSRFVCPLDWEPCDESHWRLDMRCGECEHWWEATISNERAARLDRELDDDMLLITGAVRRLDRERMATDVEAFAAALGRDLIDPADFAR